VKVCSCAATAAAVMVLAAEVAAAPIPLGDGQQNVNLRGNELVVFTYRPKQCSKPSLLLVFHGMAGVPPYRNHARSIADRNCMIVVAPRFEPRTAAYQLGGIVRRGVVQAPEDWTINIVIDIANWARTATGIKDYYLISHSADGQFLSRVAAFLPTEARRIVIGNPSTHVLATLDVKAPYGLGGVYSGAEGEEQLRRYLAQPVTIFLGNSDIGEDDDDLNTGPDAMAQGKTRLERGLNTFNSAKKLAAARGWAFNWRLVRVPGADHSARTMFGSPQALAALRP
jgi:pimeloyl-ACP methyl ester carboxylesterase